MSAKQPVSVVEAPQRPRFSHRTLWALQILAALFFFAAGLSKLAGTHYNVVVFEKVGFGQWFRYLTGVLELIGATLLLVPRLTAAGGTLLAVMMVGAVFADRVALGGTGIPALICVAVTASIAWFRRSTFTLGSRTKFD